SHFEELFEQNRRNPERALQDKMRWWGGLPEAPGTEDRMLFQWAPFLREKLSPETVTTLSPTEFGGVCARIWSIQDHARRVANATLNLPDGVPHDMATKTESLAQFIYARHSQNGSNVLQVINHVLYGGTEENIATRLWEATTDPQWRIDHLGISALGEIVG